MTEEIPVIVPKVQVPVASDGPPNYVATTDASAAAMQIHPKRKRLCRYPGCSKVIKSQGHCQRHGAKAKRCKVDGCEKQAQGTHDGMCKRHWKALHFPEETVVKEETQPPQPEGESVYDGILPQSISYRPNMINKSIIPELKPGEDPPPPPGGVSLMPLVEYLRAGISKEAGWHRNSERRARGLFPVTSLSAQLEPWERQLVLVEILLLSGGTPFANFKDLAHAWGREKGFHHVLASNVCERRGEVERKRRSDAGRKLTEEQRDSFRNKLKRTRQSNLVGPDSTGLTISGQEGQQLQQQQQHETPELLDHPNAPQTMMMAPPPPQQPQHQQSLGGTGMDTADL